MALKLQSVNTKTNWDELRKEQMKTILEQCPNISSDDVVYLRHCIKNFAGTTAQLWLETHLKDDQINEVFYYVNKAYKNYESGYSKTNKSINIFNLRRQNILNSLGEIKSKDRIFKKSEVVNVEDVEFQDGAIAFALRKDIFDNFKNSQEQIELQKKQDQLQKCMPYIKTLDLKQRETLLKLFKENNKKYGSILTVPGSGTSSIFMLVSGLVLIYQFVQGQFYIVGFLNKIGVFNEQRQLFGQDSVYGAIVVQESQVIFHLYQIFQIQAADVTKLPDEVIQTLKASFQAKNRIYQQFYDQLAKSQPEQFKESQQKLCKRHNVNYDDILNLVKQNTKNGKLESTDRQETIDKNKQLFEKTVGGNPLKNALSNMTDKERTLCMGTPRIVNRQANFLGLSEQQETSLFALRQIGTNLRKGVQTTNQVLPMPKDEINRAKSSLLEQERAHAAELLAKKSIGEKLENKPLIDKMKKTNDEIIHQYPKDQQKDKIEIIQEKVEPKQEQIQEQIEKVEKPQEQIDIPSSGDSLTNMDEGTEFKGRNQQRQGSITSQTPRQMEIASKRKVLQKLGI